MKRELKIPEELCNRNKDAKSAAKQTEFLKLKKKYKEKFGQEYSVYYGVKFDGVDEAIADMEKCIETGERSEKPWTICPYKNGVTY